MRSGANTVFQMTGVPQMILVAGDIQVHAIPAGREQNFRPQTIQALGVDERLVSDPGDVESAFVPSDSIVKAIKSNGFLRQGILCHVSIGPC